MATVSDSLATTYTQPHLRQFDAQRDLGPVADLIELCFAETLDPDGRRYLERMRSLAARPRPLLWVNSAAEWNSSPLFGYVWQEDNRVVGNASLISYPVMGKRVFLIANVAVHPDFRRRGIANQLTLRAVEYARKHQAAAVWLHVRDDNPEAQALYRQLGFLERARRTTWISCDEPTARSLTPGVKITTAQSRHWPLQRASLLRSYPLELAWHLAFDVNILNPGLWGMVMRSLKQVYIRQWPAISGNEWLGSLSWQLSSSYANTLWLGLSDKADEQVVRDLLLSARQNEVSARPMALDYPAGCFVPSIQAAGFSSHQTLIWMKLSLF